MAPLCFSFFFSSRRRHTRFDCDWSSDVCSSDLLHHQPRKELDNAADEDGDPPNDRSQTGDKSTQGREEKEGISSHEGERDSHNPQILPKRSQKRLEGLERLRKPLEGGENLVIDRVPDGVKGRLELGGQDIPQLPGFEVDKVDSLVERVVLRVPLVYGPDNIIDLVPPALQDGYQFILDKGPHSGEHRHHLVLDKGIERTKRTNHFILYPLRQRLQGRHQFALDPGPE